MADKDLVTKTYLEVRLGKFKAELRKEIANDVITFFNTSVMPTLERMENRMERMENRMERMENKIDDINDVTNTHERRLDKHDDILIQIRAGT